MERSSFLLHPTANTAHTNNIAKSTAASCTFPLVAPHATEIEPLNMTHNWYFYANSLEKRYA
jgi:hypothetical protein